MRFKRINILPATFIICLILLWHLAVTLMPVEPYILPSPEAVINEFRSSATILFQDSLATLMAAFTGFLIANIFSLLFAIIFTHSKKFEECIYPLLIALKSTPIIALAPLFIIWFGYGITSKVLMAALISFFPLVVNATQGFQSVNKSYLEYIKTLTNSKRKIFWYLRLPNALPTIFSALKISSTMAVVGAIIAEMMGAKIGLGRTIILASMNLDTPLLFTSIIISSFIGILFFYAIVGIEKILNIAKYAHK